VAAGAGKTAIAAGAGPGAGQSVAGASGPTGGVIGAGITRGGVECRPGVRQLPFSDYATPCVGKFEGDNKGATWNGVTKDTIKIVYLYDPSASSSALAPILAEAGFPDGPTTEKTLKTFTEYFNKTFELYGRKVVLERLDIAGTDQESSCADAAKAADQMKAFAVVSAGEPFTSCAVQRKLFIPLGNVYYAEPWMQKLHPYVWHVLPACDPPAADMADYVGKRLGTKKAKWAGDVATQQKNRVYGLWIPNDPWYRYCGDVFEKALKDNYGITIKSRYNYNLDINTAQQQTAQAVVQFNAAGVTSLLLFCDPIGPIFLTQNATAQNWHPEWITAGYAYTDIEGFVRLYGQDQIDGHYWGMSQLSGFRISAADGEARKAWKLASSEPWPSQQWEPLYYYYVHMFNLLQVAGPVLTPENIASGMKSYPTSGQRTGAMGLWQFAGTHTGIKDSREIYWDGKANAPDGKPGVFVETYGGRRFTGKDWPAEDPPIYPGR
jgi:hypothetical protein